MNMQVCGWRREKGVAVREGWEERDWGVYSSVCVCGEWTGGAG